MAGLWPGFSVKRQNDLISPLHSTEDETEAQRWKVVKAGQPAELESGSFSSQASEPHPCAWPDMWLPV